MKVAIFARNINLKSGLGKIIKEQIDSYLSLDDEVHLFAQNCSGLTHCKKLPTCNIFGDSFRRICYNLFAEIVVKLNKYDLIIGHGDTFKGDMLYLHNLVEKRGGTKFSSVIKFHHKMLSNLKFKKIIANSQFMKTDLINRYNINESLIDVSYPKVATNLYKPTEVEKNYAKNKLGIKNLSIPIIGLITSGDFKKRRLDKFFDIVSAIKYQNFILLIIGKDNKGWEEISKRYNHILNKTIYREPVVDIREFGFVIDILLYPADFEEFGLVIAEMDKMGVVSIISDQVGASEIIKNGIVLSDYSEKSYINALENSLLNLTSSSVL